ncbi:GNAT family N-acetyltransferase [Plantactinospora siamensis]|uniref:GNAT family N-acetyltransferase n=1 Tax=Plantactinospora siamensis TaxID=555372 RepID=A0ABV6NVL6_9ACTN
MPSLTTPAVPPGALASREQPVLAADGLLLRPWRPPDRDAVLTAYADPAIQRWHCRTMIGPEAEAWIAAWSRRWAAETDASWAVLAGDAVVGQVGLRRIDLAEGCAAVSYWVLPAARGHRTAPRALTAAAAWCFGELGLHRLELSHSTANPASCRVALRCGFPVEGTRRGQGLHADGWHDMHLHARLGTDG